MDGNRSVGEVTGAILAGGRARRFGGLEKATLDVGGVRIVDRQLATLRMVTAEQLVIANNPSAFADLGVPVVPDLVASAGPLGGLYTVLRTARLPRALVLACDLPFVHAPFLRFLIERAPTADVVVPRTANGLHPLCAVYATRIAPLVESQLAKERLAVHELFPDVATVIIEPQEVARFDDDGRLLANINTPADYDAIRGSRDQHGEPSPPDSR